MNNKLSRKKELFCKYLLVCGEPLSAAFKAGYSESEGLNLYFSTDIQHRCRTLEGKIKPSRAHALRALARLATGENSSRLTPLGESSADTLDGLSLDWFYVSKLKVLDKGVEVSFFDRQRALEVLLDYTQKEHSAKAGQEFIHALKASALADQQENQHDD